MASLPLVPQQHHNPPENLQHQQNAHRDQGAAAAVRPAVAGVRPETDSDKVLLPFFPKPHTHTLCPCYCSCSLCFDLFEFMPSPWPECSSEISPVNFPATRFFWVSCLKRGALQLLGKIMYFRNKMREQQKVFLFLVFFSFWTSLFCSS